ncbi:casein kinase 2 regulatory subunit [Exophiala dermatitidis]|nr:casein kinase 2 regulatory subunit [Exophiala dermatitidis]KAJ4549678.1 casein kinase 2 regulatory subunit [Exophiala dermatitidis]
MSQTSSQAPDSWIGTFCNLVGHEYFAEVSEDFIEDDFNLTGLQAQVPMYKEALEMILDVEPSETNSSALSEEEEEEEEEEDDGILGDELDDPADQNGAARRQSGVSSTGRRHGRTSSDASVIESSAELLYGLIHARYITSRPGIQQMMEKYELSHFGFCPRVYCSGTKVLPGNDDGESTLSPTETNTTQTGMTASRSSSLTLPQPPSIPGVNQGKDDKSSTTLASLPPQPPTINGIATHNLAPGLGKGKIYEPKIYGFRVSERAKSGPRMKWLRSKPLDINELDEARIWHERYGGTVDGDDEPPVADTDEEQDNEDVDEVEADPDGDAVMASQSQILKNDNQPRTRSKRQPEADGDATMTTTTTQAQGQKRGKARLKSANVASQGQQGGNGGWI